MPRLSRGRIVWATIPDPSGRNPKRRPLVVLTPDDQLAADGLIDVVAVTTQIDATPADVSVPLPWHRDGHPRTMLREPCVAVCTWPTLPVGVIERVGGLVPAKQLAAIDVILNRLSGGPSLPE